MRMVTFDCGHRVSLPHDPGDTVWRAYWKSQSVPRIPGGVARCPGCIRGNQPRGDVRKVVSVEELPDEGKLF